MDWRALFSLGAWGAGGPQEVLPSPRPFAGEVMLLAEGDSASLAYFVRPFLAQQGFSSTLQDSRLPPDAAQPDPARLGGIVIVRYLPTAWRGFLLAARRAGVPVAYFMDDDLLDAAAHAGLPKDYQSKLARLALSQRAHITQLASEWWVSNDALAQRYAAQKPRILPPCAPAEDATRCVTVCYHGTASHVAEQAWLLTLVEALQARTPLTHFTIVGDAALNKKFRNLPRVTVVHPLRWQNYVDHSRAHPCDIALAPLLPAPFNATRGPTKFFDFTRMGAVGLYADATPYREVVRHDVDGLLLGMEPETWLTAIVELAGDPARRQRLLAAARARCAAGPLV